ncbi:MAG: redoxin domain-containing protein [Planctomycetota bacterium]
MATQNDPPIRPEPRLEPTQPIAVGETAPNFTLTNQDKDPWTLADAVKKGHVALCFYPMDFSPVCSTEMKCVTDQMADWQSRGVEVVGISCDSFFVHEAWANAMGLKQTLLADMHRDVCKAYGFYWPDLNIAGRGTVLIEQADNGQGRVRWVEKRDIPEAMALENLLAILA